jgi:NAD(P)-dependent dehydrogenase (short-subunit alcohol dehydrogenase family)
MPGGSFISSALKLSENGWDSVIRENLKPAFVFSKAVVNSMIEHGGGSIVNIASTEALRASVTNPAYGAAKAGIVNLTMSLAHEWAQYNIRVNAVAPGFIEVPV